ADEVPTSGLPDRFQISIWTNEPPSPYPWDPMNYDHPGMIVHTVTLDNNDYTIDFEGWDVDPRDPMGAEPDTAKLSKFMFEGLLDIDDWWYQPADNDIYWISIQALYDTPPTTLQWGWETRPQHPVNGGSGALRTSLYGFGYEPIGLYDELFVFEPWDLSFELLFSPLDMNDPNLPIDGPKGRDGVDGADGLMGRALWNGDPFFPLPDPCDPNGYRGADGYSGGTGGDVLGGAMYFDANSSPLISYVRIINCGAIGGDGGFGGQGQNGRNGQNGQDGQPGP
ncbi:unnamed protein product, partial [marine sediment metagenome]